MTTSNFQPDDPRLTAYALGELDHSERAEVESLLAESAEACMALEGIRETIALLRSELTFQPTLTLTCSQREIVTQAVVVPNQVVEHAAAAANSGRPSRWVVMVRAATTVAAVAVVAVAVPWLSRSGSSNHSASEALMAAASRAPDESTFRGEASKSAGSTGPGLMGDFGSMDPESRVGRVVTENRVENIGETVESVSTEEAAGNPVSNDSLAAIVLTDDLLELSRSDSSSPSGEGEPSDDRRAKQASLAGDTAGSNSARSRSGEANGETSLLALQSADGGKNESRVTSRDLESVVDAKASSQSTDFLSLGKSEEQRSSLTLVVPEFEAESSLKGMAHSGRHFYPGDLADPGIMQRGRSTELGEEKLARFRNLSEAAPGSEAYDAIVENTFITPMEQPLSTFSIDVDTASYANTRRFIQHGQLPPANAVRIEELVNYFRYDYPEPIDGSPFSVNVDVATCPWEPQHKLARVGLKARTIAEDKRPATNLVFLIDVSGSMAAENKLPLVKQALSVLVSKMGEDDQIAIVTYAGEAGLKLNSTSGSQRNVIQQAIDSLSSGGSTNGAAGISIAYDTAIQSFIKGGANRVILCTDGDFNVGVSDDNTLVEIIQEKAASGVFLSVFGFGMGNLKDAKLEKLADKGNGNYGYIDGLQEARKVFGEQLSGTLITVAKDVKLQLEFSNSTVGAYRLIGYENRVLAARDFDDDTKDAGEIGAGHTVTALYEIVPKAVWLTQKGLNPEKFDIVEKNVEDKEEVDGQLFTVKLRHKLPDAETSERSMDYAAMNSDVPLSDSHVDFRFAAAVASFGMQIRDSEFRGQWTLQNVLSMAEVSLAEDRSGERTEFTDLVRGVMRIKGESVLDPRHTSHPTIENPADLPAELSASDARIKATVDGKYRRLLKKIEVRSDVATYGDFRDFGHWDQTVYSGYSDLPTGYWVWVYPNWYIWGDAVETAGSESARESEGTVGTSSPAEVP